MALDITGLIIIALFFIRGFMKGFIVAVFSMIAILLGILVSLKLSQTFSAWLLAKGYTLAGWAPILSYIILFIGVVLVVHLLAKLLQKAVEGMMLGIVNKIAGGVFYALLGAILWSSLLWLGNNVHVFSPELVAASKTYSWMSRLAPWFFDTAGKLMPFVKDTFTELQHFFDSVNQKQAVHVGAN